MNSELRWSFSNEWFWAGAVVLATLFCLSLWNLHRRDWERRHLFLESFRFLLATAVLLALAKPETWRMVKPEEPTRFLVLTDRSTSMETEDMTRSDGETVSRRTWVEGHMSWQDRLGEQIVLDHVDFESPESGQTDLHAALGMAQGRDDRLGGIILLSDGDWNAGPSPVEAALSLRRKGIPIIAVAVGREEALPDISVAWLPMPRTLIVDEPTRLPYQIKNRFAREVEVTLTFSPGEQASAQSRTVRLAPGSSLQDAFLWKPLEEGNRTLRLQTPLLPGETREDNNATEAEVRVKRDRLNVLLVDSAPRWEFRYLRNALMRDPGVDVSCLLFHPNAELGLGQGPGYLDAFPPTRDALTAYDVLFLGDVGLGEGQLTEAQTEQLRGLVEQQASGLVFLPGRLGHQQRLIDSPLGDLIPVIADETAPATGVQAPGPSALELTQSGRESVLLVLGEGAAETAAIWRSLPGFYWHAPISRAKAGATVLAVHESARNGYGRLPLLVTRPFGSGKVLYLGTDGAWRWRRGVEDLYHYRFWSQVARWMAYQRNLAEGARGRIIHYPDAPVAGREVTIHATLLDRNRGPLSKAKPTLTWTRRAEEDRADSRGEEAGTLALTESEGGWGVYRGSWTPPQGGSYTLSVRTPEEPSFDLTTTLRVASSVREATGDPARPDVLRQLAAASKGAFLSSDAVGSLPEALSPLARAEPIVQRHEWWRHPAFLALLVAGLSGYWIARKRMGLV